MEDVGIVQRLEQWFLKCIRKECVLVEGFIAPDERVKALLLSKHPIKEAKVTVGDLHPARLVYRRIERELDSFNHMKRDGILQTANIFSSSAAATRQRRMGALTSIGTECFPNQVLWRHLKDRLRNPCCVESGMGHKKENATVSSI